MYLTGRFSSLFYLNISNDSKLATLKCTSDLYMLQYINYISVKLFHVCFLNFVSLWDSGYYKKVLLD